MIEQDATAAIYLCGFFILIVTWMVFAHLSADRPVKAYDISAEKYVKIPRKVFHDDKGMYHSYSEFELYILGSEIADFGSPGDLLLCKTEAPREGRWCIWWDLLAGPQVFELRAKDCVRHWDRLPIVKFIIRKGEY